jgi:hypothetical protein
MYAITDWALYRLLLVGLVRTEVKTLRATSAEVSILFEARDYTIAHMAQVSGLEQ